MALAVAFAAAAVCPAAALSPVRVAAAIRTIQAAPIRNDSNQVSSWEVFVGFTKDFVVSNAGDKAKAENPANYRLINVNTGERVPVSGAGFLDISGGASSKVKLIVPRGGDLNGSDLFHLYAMGLTFGGEAADAALQGPVTVAGLTAPSPPPVDGSTPTPIPEIKPAWGLKSSKDRDDSDFYASYQVTSAKHRATTGTGDVKVSIPFFKNFWKRTSKFAPFVDFKASSDHTADADSMKFGVEWFLPVYVHDDPDAKFPYTAVDWINTGKVEAPKNFNNVNAVWESRWLFPSTRLLGSGKKFRLFIDPFVGHELGKNLRSPLDEADGKGVARVYAGANLTAHSQISNVSILKGFEFTTSYIRRWPLVRELNVKEDATGGAELLAFGKGPKDYLDAKFLVKVNDYFGPFVGFERGMLPPVYKFVDHKWTFGVLFKSKVRVKGAR